MQFPITLLAALTYALTATASPVDKRACKITAPSGPLPRSIDIAKVASPPSSTPAQIGFRIPRHPGKGPCSLMASLPAGYPVTTSGNPQLNFIALDGPATGSIVGTATLAPGEVRTINSFSCRPRMGFRIEIAGVEGRVEFELTEGAGLFMTYDC